MKAMPIQIRVTEHERAALAAVAADRRISMSELIRMDAIAPAVAIASQRLLSEEALPHTAVAAAHEPSRRRPRRRK